MIVDIIATLIILAATLISIAGAVLVSGTTNGDRKRGFWLWQISNFAWVCTFVMGMIGLISASVFTIQQFCACLTFLIYFICNYRGVRNNGGTNL
jgi:hypothetical protein